MEQDGAHDGAYGKEQGSVGEKEQKGAPDGDDRGHGRPQQMSKRKGPAE